MKIRKELWFGFVLMALIVAAAIGMLLSVEKVTNGHIGLLMLSLVVVAIMLGFPTAFTLMGMGMLFTWLAYERDTTRTLDLMVQSAFKVMGNDVLIAIPLFVFMGYLVERANLIEKLFRSLHLSMARVPGSLAVATLVTCAVFAAATGIVGAVVTLMGLLALPAMLRAGYSVPVSAGAITAGGCLGILIPPSVLLIVYGATAGVSVVQLYAGAFFPGLMLAGLYVVYVIILAKLKPAWAPPLSADERTVALPRPLVSLGATHEDRALPFLMRAVRTGGNAEASPRYLRRQLLVLLLPAIFFLLGGIWAYSQSTATPTVYEVPVELERLGAGHSSGGSSGLAEPPGSGLAEPPGSGLAEPPGSDDVTAPASGLAEPPGAGDAVANGVSEPPGAPAAAGGLSEPPGEAVPEADAERRAPSSTFWIVLGIGALALLAYYALLNMARLEIFKMLLASFFPLVVLILAVLGSIVFGLATPTEAAAVGAFGGYGLACLYALNKRRREAGALRTFLLWTLLWLPALATIGWFLAGRSGVVAAPVPMSLGWLAVATVAVWCVLAYRQAGLKGEVSESVYLTAKTSAMVCWLFVGSAIFSAAFALLGGQELVEQWVLSMNLTKTQFLILTQVIIFILGWPLEWTEIIVIFMPIFVPLLDNFGVDPLFFGLLVALNLQTAFLSPPVAMSAFYLKGVAPPHVTLNQIFLGMLPFMGIQILAIVLLYIFPQIGLWLPQNGLT